MEKITTLFSYTDVIIIGLSFCAFYVTRKVFPVIIYLSHKKNLMDEPVERSSHSKKTPNLGGIGIFISFLLCICLSGSLVTLEKIELSNLLAIVGAVSVLFFMGIKDDLISISPIKKLMSQFVAASIIVFAANLRIESFYGLFGIGELSIGISIVVSIFAFLFFTNAFNLIDGIDGLIGVQGVIGSFVLGVFFVLGNQIFAAILSFVLLACLLGFLSFNLSDNNKIFMGDCGSLFVGFLLTILAFYFLKLNFENTNNLLPNKLVLLFAIFAFPVLDTIRVFFLRIASGKSPFQADKNHLHHKLLDLGLSHINATITIAVSNIVLISLTLLTDSLESGNELVLLFFIAVGLFYSPFLIKKKNKKRGSRLVTNIWN